MCKAISADLEYFTLRKAGDSSPISDAWRRSFISILDDFDGGYKKLAVTSGISERSIQRYNTPPSDNFQYGTPYLPNRHKVIQLALGLLVRKQTLDTWLWLLGYSALYARTPTDAAAIYFLENYKGENKGADYGTFVKLLMQTSAEALFAEPDEMQNAALLVHPTTKGPTRALNHALSFLPASENTDLLLSWCKANKELFVELGPRVYDHFKAYIEANHNCTIRQCFEGLDHQNTYCSYLTKLKKAQAIVLNRFNLIAIGLGLGMSEVQLNALLNVAKMPALFHDDQSERVLLFALRMLQIGQINPKLIEDAQLVKLLSDDIPNDQRIELLYAFLNQPTVTTLPTLTMDTIKDDARNLPDHIFTALLDAFHLPDDPDECLAQLQANHRRDLVQWFKLIGPTPNK